MKLGLTILLFLFSNNLFAADTNDNTSATDIKTESQHSTAPVDIATDLPDTKISITLFSLGGIKDQQFKSADPSMDFFDNYISFNYKINGSFRISARPAFGYSTAGLDYRGQEVTNAIRTRDFSLVAKITRLFEESFSPAFELSNQFRLFLPTSDFSKDTGMIAKLRYEIEGGYYFTDISYFRYYVKPSYYFQRSTVYLDNSNPRYPGSVKTTPKIDIEHGGEFKFSLNRKFAFKPGFEIQEKWSNSSSAEAKDEYHATTIRTSAGVEFRPNRDLNFTIAIDSSRDLIAASKDPETGYTLMTNVSLF